MKLYILVVLLLLPLTQATLPLCEHKQEIFTNCTMLTPSINCTTNNYTIIQSNGSIIIESTLENVYNDIYKFNFTYEEGDYIIRLCDGTTREIRVIQEDENKMIIAITILLPLILTIIALVGAATLGKEHTALRIALFLFSFVPFFASAHFAVMGIAQFYNMPTLIDQLGGTIYWTGLIMGLITTYFIIYAFYIGIHFMAQKKNERLEY